MKATILSIIRFYQSSLSPAIPSSCRFYPTCSAYAYECISTWGVKNGLRLALRRVLRCRPFGGYGCDPVPARLEPSECPRSETCCPEGAAAPFEGFE